MAEKDDFSDQRLVAFMNDLARLLELDLKKVKPEVFLFGLMNALRTNRLRIVNWAYDE